MGPSLVTVHRVRSGNRTTWVLRRDGKRVDGFLKQGRANRKAGELNREIAMAEPVWGGPGELSKAAPGDA